MGKISRTKHIISVDPGDVNNGFCYFKYFPESKTADLIIMKICGPTELSTLLKVIWGLGQRPSEEPKPQNNPHNMYFVIENFRMDSHVRGAVFQWNEMLTSQMIGRVKLCAEWMDAPVFMQEAANVLPLGRKWVPFKVNKGHLRDDHSAFIHGVHFMMTKGLITDVSKVKLFGQETLI